MPRFINGQRYLEKEIKRGDTKDAIKDKLKTM